MRRTGGGWRVLSAWVALMVLPSLAPDLFGLPCPHHAGSHVDGSASHAAPAPGGHDAGDPSAPDGPAPAKTPHAPAPATPVSGERTPAPVPSGAGHGAPCTCAGNCPVSGGITLSGVYPRPIPVASAARLRATDPAAAHALPSAPAHFLPFSIGPPSA